MSKQYLDAEFVGDVDFRPVRKAWVYKKDKPKNDILGLLQQKVKQDMRQSWVDIVVMIRQKSISYHI